MNVTAVVRHMREVTPTLTRWLWPDYLPAGKLTLIDGDPGLGKSFLSLDVAARLSSGRPYPVGEGAFTLGKVLLITCEDGVADCIVPRLQALHANLNKVFTLDGCVADGSEFVAPPLFPRDLPLLRDVLDRLRPALVVIDPLLAYIELGYSSINDQAIRQVLTPLAMLAADFDSAFLLIRHLNKTGGSKAIYRGSGSIGIVGSARLSFLVGKHPADETARVLAPVKSNLGPLPLAIAWRLVNHPTLEMQWLGEVEYSADDLVTPSSEKQTALERAEKFLRTQLSSGPKAGDLISQLGRGIGLSGRTLERAKQALGILCRRVGKNDFVWEMPALFGAPTEPPLEG
jgi:hypothetical protein